MVHFWILIYSYKPKVWWSRETGVHPKYGRLTFDFKLSLQFSSLLEKENLLAQYLSSTYQLPSKKILQLTDFTCNYVASTQTQQQFNISRMTTSQVWSHLMLLHFAFKKEPVLKALFIFSLPPSPSKKSPHKLCQRMN